MDRDSSVRTFKCPNCGSPLEAQAGKTSMKCSYCGNTIAIPKAFRIAARPDAPPSESEATRVPPRPVADSRSTDGGKPRINGGILVVVVVLALAVVAYFAFGANLISGMLFSHQVMSFGTKGIGQGMLENGNAIAVDGSGYIVIGDSQSGRIQVFGPDGKFMALFNITGKTTNHHVQGIAASHDGKIYIADGIILMYDEQGQFLGQFGDRQLGYSDVTLGADGTVYALSGDTIVRFTRDGAIDLQIDKAVSGITGEPDGIPHLAVDGLGNMYVVDDSAEAVFKYSAAGKFVNQFGGKVELAGSCRNCNTFQPGKFWSPNGIAVDGHGRIFVSDLDATQVFDSTGKFINNLSGGYFAIALDPQGNLYATSFLDHNVVKYQVQQP